MRDSQKIAKWLKKARKIPAGQNQQRERAWQHFATNFLKGIPDQSRAYQLTQGMFRWLCYESPSLSLPPESDSLFTLLREQTDLAYLLYLYGLGEGVKYQRKLSTHLAVFVPAASNDLMALAPGTAIVGPAGIDEAEEVTVYFEGALRNPEAGRNTYADRAYIAASWLIMHHPTNACATVSREALCHIGWFDPEKGITLLDNEYAKEILASWLGVETIEENDLLLSR